MTLLAWQAEKYSRKEGGFEKIQPRYQMMALLCMNSVNLDKLRNLSSTLQLYNGKNSTYLTGIL